MSLDAFSSFDWRSLNKYASPQAMEDFNVFLEALPQRANKMLLITAGVIWAAAAAMGLFAAVKMQDVSERKMELDEAQALNPNVPLLRNKPVSAKEVARFVDELRETYKGLEIKGNGANIVIMAKATSRFGEFREAVGHVQNGGVGWRVNLDRFCIGLECQQYPLAAAMKINRVSVENATQ